jgi:hypothetical protein
VRLHDHMVTMLQQDMYSPARLSDTVNALHHIVNQ